MNADFINLRTGETAYENRLIDRYREELNDIYPDVVMGAMSWPAGDTLERMDPIGFRCGFVDWLDAEGWEDT